MRTMSPYSRAALRITSSGLRNRFSDTPRNGSPFGPGNARFPFALIEFRQGTALAVPNRSGDSGVLTPEVGPSIKYAPSSILLHKFLDPAASRLNPIKWFLSLDLGLGKIHATRTRVRNRGIRGS